MAELERLHGSIGLSFLERYISWLFLCLCSYYLTTSSFLFIGIELIPKNLFYSSPLVPLSAICHHHTSFSTQHLYISTGMCYTAEDVARIEMEVKNEVDFDTNRHNIFIDRLLEVKRNCRICQVRKEQEDVEKMENRRREANTFHEYTVTQLGIGIPRPLSDAISSSNSPSPPRQRDVERFSPYPTSGHQPCPLQTVIAESSQPLHYNQFPPKQATPLSYDPSQNPFPTPMNPPHTSTPISNQKANLETAGRSEFERWLQKIDNPSPPPENGSPKTTTTTPTSTT